MLGGSVCRMHGGAAPQVRRAAHMRILEASDKAAARLIEMMQDRTIPPAVQLAAARDLLDRAGLIGKQEIELDIKLSRFEQVAADILVDVDDELGTIDNNVIDAEVVDEDAFDEEVRLRETVRNRRRKRGKPMAELPSVTQARSKR